MSSETKVVTNKVRLSYENLWAPRSINGSSPKYSASIIIPKSDKETILAIEKAVDMAIEEGIPKFWSKIPPKNELRLPLRDGDVEKEEESYKDSYFLNANSTSPPQIVDKDIRPITDTREVYSGVYGRFSLNFYPYCTNGKKGIACGLGNFQKLCDGEFLGNKSSAMEDFGTEKFTQIEEDFLD